MAEPLAELKGFQGLSRACMRVYENRVEVVKFRSFSGDETNSLRLDQIARVGVKVGRYNSIVVESVGGHTIGVSRAKKKEVEKTAATLRGLTG